MGQEKVVAGKWGQLYLNNNKKMKKKELSKQEEQRQKSEHGKLFEGLHNIILIAM